MQQLLKLARVSPVIMKAYRDDKLKLEQVTAFAVSDDHEAQERLLQSFGPHGREARAIRAALTEGVIATDDKRVKFVTLKAYRKAGGEVRPDWFGKDADSGFILDKGLLDRLLAEKFDSARKELAKEGWKWTDAYSGFGYQEQGQFAAPPARVRALARRSWPRKRRSSKPKREKLEQQWESRRTRTPSIPNALMKSASASLKSMTAAKKIGRRKSLPSPGPLLPLARTESLKSCVASCDPRTCRRRTRRPRPKPRSPAPATRLSRGKQSPALSAALVESLTAHKSAALAAELAERPDIALAAVVHGFASRVLLDVLTEGRSLQIAAHPQSLDRVKGSKAFERMEAARKKWRGQLPADADALWTWCLGQKQETLLGASRLLCRRDRERRTGQGRPAARPNG